MLGTLAPISGTTHSPPAILGGMYMIWLFRATPWRSMARHDVPWHCHGLSCEDTHDLTLLRGCFVVGPWDFSWDTRGQSMVVILWASHGHPVDIS